MWPKTIVGFIISLALSISLLFNIDNVLPIPTQVFLLSAFIGMFALWPAIMSYFYCIPSIKKPMFICVPVLIVSAGINALFYLW